MDNVFCKDCDHNSPFLGWCAYGHREFKYEGPVDCRSFTLKEIPNVSNKFIPCNSCQHKGVLKERRGKEKDFCIKDQVFFKTKKAEGCTLYTPIVSSNVFPIILQPKKDIPLYFPPAERKYYVPPAKKFIKTEDDFSYVKMVE